MTSVRTMARPRRVLLGVGGDGEVRTGIDAAVMLAAGFGAHLKCVIVEREELLAAAALPFSRATGYGGLSVPISPREISRHFRHLALSLERMLLERCATIALDWSLERPQGDYLLQIAGSVEEGDVLVLNPREVLEHRGVWPVLLESLLTKAAAVVLPAQDATARNIVMAPYRAADPGNNTDLADALARALGGRLERLPSADIALRAHDAGVVVLPLAAVAALGGVALVRSLRAMRTTLVVVPD